MPKRTSAKRGAAKEAASDRAEETPRTTKSNAVLDEEENRRALDETAGVTPVRSSLAPPPVTRPANAQPLLKPNTREKLLYKLASTGSPLSQEFFDEFKDTQEVLALAHAISIRFLAVAICDTGLASTQRIAAMRLVAALNGKQLPSADEETRVSMSPPPLTLPTGATNDVEKSLEKIRELSKAS